MKFLGERTQFHCPKCGGCEFRTIDQLCVPDLWTRQCKGGRKTQCGFEWPGRDDWKYMRWVSHAAFVTREEYQAHRDSENQKLTAECFAKVPR